MPTTPVPVEGQILAALKAMLLATNTSAGNSVHVHRTEADPFGPAELPAINLLAVEENIATPNTLGMVVSGALHHHRLQLVVQVVCSGTGTAAADQARLVSAQCAQAMANDPTLGGLCSEAVLPRGKQWLHDDEGERPAVRQNNLWICAYRTHSRDPFTAV